jgi:hypothetical protein
MDWDRTRRLASGVLIVGALLSGAIVGNMLLLGSADHAGDPVGHLSARIAGQAAPPAATTRADDATTQPLTGTSAPTSTSSSPGSADTPREPQREPDD